MSELDRLKERIAFEKQAFFLLFAAGMALIGWLAGHFLETERLYVYLGIGALLGISVALAILLKSILNKIESLRDL